MNKNQARDDLLNDFTLYAEKCLKIRTKDGQIKPLTLNKAQKHIHQKLEEQKKLTGKVRALILKGRQQGCSTYVAARYYHCVTQSFGRKVFILTHLRDATDNLYRLVQRFHENLPSFIKPSTGISNAKELYFDGLDSGYAVGTAGGGTVGRSDTIQMLHGSEVAFWQNTDEISTGLMQAIPTSKDSEIILESTANGIGNMFQKMCMESLENKNGYQLIFVPWYWQDEYREELPEDFVLSPEESEYKDLYDLDNEQIMWRRIKISSLTGGEWKFKQEYPATASEAFETSNLNSFIQPQYIIKARKAKNIMRGDQLIIGVDPAYMGSDRTAIVFRNGRVQYRHELMEKKDTMEVATRIMQIIYNNKPEKVFVDIGGIGAGIYDRLKELNFGNIVTAVNFGSKADDVEKYANKRAEMWARLQEWLQSEAVKIEDNEELHTELVAPEFKYNTMNQLLLESKDSMRKRRVKSPDLGDALALTFAYLIPNKQFRDRYGAITKQFQAESKWDPFS